MKNLRIILIAVTLISCMLLNSAAASAVTDISSADLLVSTLCSQAVIINFSLCTTLPLKIVQQYVMVQQSPTDTPFPHPRKTDASADTNAASTGILVQSPTSPKPGLEKMKTWTPFSLHRVQANHRLELTAVLTALPVHTNYFLFCLLALLLLPHRLSYTDLVRSQPLLCCAVTQSCCSDWVFYCLHHTSGGDL